MIILNQLRAKTLQIWYNIIMIPNYDIARSPDYSSTVDVYDHRPSLIGEITPRRRKLFEVLGQVGVSAMPKPELLDIKVPETPVLPPEEIPEIN